MMIAARIAIEPSPPASRRAIMIVKRDAIHPAMIDPSRMPSGVEPRIVVPNRMSNATAGGWSK
jgi:hypothetical protein